MDNVVDWTDPESGRKYKVRLPEGASAANAFAGEPLGPPSLVRLGLPEKMETALHNELFYRNLITHIDVRRPGGREEVARAIATALALNVQSVVDEFIRAEEPQEAIDLTRPLPNQMVVTEETGVETPRRRRHNA